MNIRSLALLLAVTAAPVWLDTPVFAQTAEDDTLKNVGSANWRIGSPVSSSAIYVDAPANLTKENGGYIAKNEVMTVALRRGFASELKAIQNEYFEKIGGKTTDAKSDTIAGYKALRLDKDGATAIVTEYGSNVWAVAYTPGTAPNAKTEIAESVKQIWFERLETPEWKDRAIGTTSFQADLPFELVARPSKDADTVSQSLRWNNLWIDATEWRSGRTDLEGTIKLQNESLQKNPRLENIKIKEVDREYGWGFLNKGERGKFVQIDYTEGGEPRRIYKVYSVAGTRVIVFQITLNVKNPQHLLAAHRILGTSRLGWTDSNDFKTQSIAAEKFSIDSDSPYTKLDVQGLRAYRGTDPLSFVFIIPRPKPAVPEASETDLDAQAMLELAIKGVVNGAGAKLENSKITQLGGSVFPTRRIYFEAKAGDKNITGDGVLIAQANQVVLPFRMATTSSYDFARRWATTFHSDGPTPSNWPKRTFGGVELAAPTDATVSADGNELSFEKDGVKVKVTKAFGNYDGAPNFNPGPNETSPITTSEIDFALSSSSYSAQDAVTKAAKEVGATNTNTPLQSASAGNAFGMAGWFASNDTKYPRLDVVTLHNGTQSWTMTLGWDPKSATSVAARDGVLGSVWGK